MRYDGFVLFFFISHLLQFLFGFVFFFSVIKLILQFYIFLFAFFYSPFKYFVVSLCLFWHNFSPKYLTVSIISNQMWSVTSIFLLCMEHHNYFLFFLNHISTQSFLCFLCFENFQAVYLFNNGAPFLLCTAPSFFSISLNFTLSFVFVSLAGVGS